MVLITTWVKIPPHAYVCVYFNLTIYRYTLYNIPVLHLPLEPLPLRTFEVQPSYAHLTTEKILSSATRRRPKLYWSTNTTPKQLPWFSEQLLSEQVYHPVDQQHEYYKVAHEKPVEEEIEGDIKYDFRTKTHYVDR